jgi:SpoIID/LytB domain protein
VVRLSRLFRAIALAGAMCALLVPPLHAGAQPAPTGAVYELNDPNQALVFEGQGWGHGIGLCQWGARGRATAGQSAEQIIGAYYGGTSIQKAVAPETTIRVLVHGGFQPEPAKPATIVGADGNWQLETSGVAPIAASAGAQLSIISDGAQPFPSMRYEVKNTAGQLIGGGALRAPLVIRPADPKTRFTVVYKPAGDVPSRPGTYYDTYRGELIVAQREDGLETINRLSLEDYLRGVVPAEMPASWPAEALKAQTFAARSYAVWQARGRSGQRFDVDDTTAFQVYKGANIEQPNVNQVVDATAGQVVTFGGQVIQAYFFSTCAGWTENNEAVWPGGIPLPYLRGIRDADPSGKPYDAGAPLSSWSTGALTVSQLEKALNGSEVTEVGRLMSIDLSRRLPSGRLASIAITGTAGTKTVRPDAFMIRFNNDRPSGVSQLYSTSFDLKFTSQSALVQTQGGIPGTPTAGPPPATRTPMSNQPVPGQPTPARTATPPPTPTPAFRLEMTQPAAAKPNGATNTFFPETGHNVGGAFLTFYNAQGGLDTFGYPRTEEILEDGRTVQYFQRARYEFHIDKAGTPYEVQLTLLGDSLTTARRPFPVTTPFASSADHVFFPETSHGLHYGFLNYWRNRGALDVFGYPISEELSENGFTVQYFQRARFEYHPEHAGTPYEVQLGLLGDQTLQQKLWLR